MSPVEIEKLMSLLSGPRPPAPAGTPSVKEYLSLQSGYLDLQRQFMELLSKSRTLADELEGCKKRSAEPGHYSLYEVSPGVVVMKSNRAAGEPVHYLCPDCFSNDRSKVFLQGDPNDWRRRCQRCQVSFWFGPPKAPDPETAAPASEPESEPQAATPETDTDSSASLAQEWRKHETVGPMVMDFQSQMEMVRFTLSRASELHQRVKLAKIGAEVESGETLSPWPPRAIVIPARRDQTEVRLERIRAHVDKLIEGLGGGATP